VKSKLHGKFVIHEEFCRVCPRGRSRQSRIVVRIYLFVVTRRSQCRVLGASQVLEHHVLFVGDCRIGRRESDESPEIAFTDHRYSREDSQEAGKGRDACGIEYVEKESEADQRIGRKLKGQTYVSKEGNS